MKIESRENVDPTIEQLVELLLRFGRARPSLISPGQFAEFKKEMISSNINVSALLDDYPFIIRFFFNIVRRELPPTMGELSEDINVPLSTATRIVDWLVKGQVVERIPDPSDRRIVRVGMTETGKYYLKVAREFTRQRLASLLAGFSDAEKKEMVRLFGKLMEAIEQGQ